MAHGTGPAATSARSLPGFLQGVVTPSVTRLLTVVWAGFHGKCLCNTINYSRISCYQGKNKEMRDKRALDVIDLNILNELQQDGRLSIVELARRVHLTKTPCTERARRLERDGVIRGYRAELDPDSLGAAHVAFVKVSLHATGGGDLDRFNAAVGKVPEVQSCHMIAGDFDYLLKVRTRDISSYRSVLGDVINMLPGVRTTATYVVMENVKDETVLPIPQP